jgi:hypothetical protein
MAKGLAAVQAASGQTLAQKMALQFAYELDQFCSTGFNTDLQITKQLYQQYIQVLGKNPFEDFPKDVPFFRSSGTGKCLREQTLRAIDALEGTDRADKRSVQPHQNRWQNIGTAIGDMVQMYVLMMEKHYERLVGEPCHFRFERTPEGYPMFEEFSSDFQEFKSGKISFITGGSLDGIMIYTDPDTGEEHRVGLEVKSKQTTYAATGHWSMKEANSKHVWQVTNYAMLKDLDQYLIVYVNASHKTWNISDEDYAKYPDFRVFGVETPEDKKKEVRNRFFTAVEMAHEGVFPKLSLADWTFNDYKTACALSLTYKELEELKLEASGKFQEEAIKEIEKIRGDVK